MEQPPPPTTAAGCSLRATALRESALPPEEWADEVALALGRLACCLERAKSSAAPREARPTANVRGDRMGVGGGLQWPVRLASELTDLHGASARLAVRLADALASARARGTGRTGGCDSERGGRSGVRAAAEVAGGQAGEDGGSVTSGLGCGDGAPFLAWGPGCKFGDMPPVLGIPLR